MRKFLILIICFLPSVAFAANPTISNVTGTVATGQTLTITGTNMMQLNETNWTSFFQGGAYDFVNNPQTDGYRNVGNQNGSYVTSPLLEGTHSMAYPLTDGSNDGGQFDVKGGSNLNLWLRTYTMYTGNGNWPTITLKMTGFVNSGGGDTYFQPAMSGGSAPTQWRSTTGDASGTNNQYGTMTNPSSLQQNRWYLVEEHVQSNQVDVWVDGVQYISHAISPTLSGGYNWFEMGIINCTAISGVTLTNYYSGTTVSTSRVYASSYIEISGDGGSTWTYQPPTSLSETSIAITAALPTLTAANYILRVTNNSQMIAASGNTATAGGATYALGGGSSPNANVSLTGLGSSGSNGTITSPVSGAQLIFSEGFDDTNFAARGWYDGIPSSIATTGCYSGAGCSIWTFNSGGTNPTQMPAGSMRHEFTATDTIYTSFWIKFATGWEGSQQTVHPHIICLLSDLDDTANPYSALAANYLNTYIEFHSDVFASQGDYNIYSQIDLQDEKNTNPNYGAVPNDLRAMTENRSVNQCNTPSYDGAVASCYADGVTCTSGMNCYPSGTSFYSANDWIATTPPVSTGAWHHIEAYMKMNSIVGGIGQTDGIMQEWMDGTQTINFSNMIYRTGQHPTMKWAQFTISPFIGNGSPVTQTMYIDSLAVYNGLPGTASSSSLNLSGLGGTCGTGSITAAMTYSPVVSLTGNGCGSGVGYPGGMGVGAGIQAIFSNVIMQ